MSRGVVYIMRGVPGSGKTTLAEYLIGYNDRVFSADDFFTTYNHETGKEEYNWKPKFLSAAHRSAREGLVRAMNNGISPLALDNTHCVQEHFDQARELVEAHGYTAVEVALLPPEGNAALSAYVDLCAARNVHGVPRASILRMALQLRDGKFLGGPTPKIRLHEDTGVVELADQTFPSIGAALRACETGELGVIPYGDESFMNKLYAIEDAAA